MIRHAVQAGGTDAEPASTSEHIAQVPRISIQAFCESAETAGLMQTAGEDRVQEAIANILPPFKQVSGSYRLENTFRYLIATT